MGKGLVSLDPLERCPVRLSSRGFRFDSQVVLTLNLDLAFSLQPSRKPRFDYSPTSVLISARNVSCCSAAQESSRENK
jgi:hypothetical protein